MSKTTVSQISIYPIKSTAGIDISDTWVEEKGLSFDRRFVVSDLQGNFITARTEAKLCLIQSTLTAAGMKLSAPNMPTLTIDYATLADSYTDVIVWKDAISAQQCSEDINQWFTQYLDKPCQLLFFGEQSKRKVKNRTSQVGFADGYPLLLISEASLEELNRRTSSNVSMSQFRPNLVVSQCSAFEEDTWKRIRIGEVEFEVTKPCSRCIFTTIDPRTGLKSDDREPLTTLKAFRQGESGDVYFGQNLVALNEGKVSLDDEIEVLAYQTPELYPDKQNRQSISTKTAQTKSAIWTATSPIELTCIDIVDDTHDVKTFTFNHNTIKQFRYIAGQHLPLTFSVGDKLIKRQYTISSSPTQPETLSITVKRIGDGEISNFLHDHFKVGDTVKALLPSGDFHLNRASQDKILFLTAGSGITPALSMLRTMVANGDTRDTVFFHSTKMARDLIAEEEVALLARQHGQCRVDYTLTQGITPTWPGYQGRLTEEMLTSIPALTQRSVFVCGPDEFMQSAKAMLLSLGLPENQYYQESFGGKKLAVETVGQKKAVNILFDSWDKTHSGNTQETILEQAESAGLILPYSCRAGMCGRCKVKLDSGEVRQLADDGLMPDEKAQGFILSCSCIPQSDLVISRD